MSLIAYTIDRKRSRKHTYITIQRDGSVLVKTNFFTSKHTIEKFIIQKTSWIQQKQSAIQDALNEEKTKLFILGQTYDKDILSGINIDIFYKNKAIEIILPLVSKWSKEMSLYPTHIGFRKNKSRWGSCSSKDRITFNTQLIKTPIEFIEYVVVHELAHIEYKNHSKSFWNLVKEYLPDYKQRKNMIKNQHFLL